MPSIISKPVHINNSWAVLLKRRALDEEIYESWLGQLYTYDLR